ncbi:polyprenol phosphomannose-dependent alpha 1,6 mannosyltransferase MptB [Agilicoccus flavus]|uniref:polyprenol phosphomannose-dependent alpha 1,6 mannosyltransferase MptB n=1 Tax=Agilicoccus flavus TaxID=2775968 RepID=UPI001CF675C6|nr:polyprenol phosphomannose-dependent alpha 1,6 mannosyltransferase MptB [Agilicoccus flavus]
MSDVSAERGAGPRARRPRPFRAAMRTLRADLRAAWALLYVRHGLAGMALIALGAYTPAFLPPDSPILELLHLDWLADGPSRVVATGLIIGGMAILVHAWLRLRPTRTSGPLPTSTWLIWAAPVMLTPPLFSRDTYSYAAQGLIVDRGMDPYATAPISVPGSFADQVDAMWLYTPAPYGPLALQLQHLVVDLTFGNAFVASVAMRIPAVAAVAVVALLLPRLAARVGVDPRGAVWLGVLNPLVVLHLVGGAHNDAMMIACVVLGLYLAADGRLGAGALAVAAGAGFKQTAVLALVGVAGLAARRIHGGLTPPRRDYLLVALHTGLVAFAGFVALTLASGLGWGWVPNLSVPMALRSYLAPTTLLGSIVQLGLSAAGAPAAWVAQPVPAAQALGAIVAVGTLLWLTWSVAPRHPLGSAAAAFTVVVACGPVMQPWYLLPCLVLYGVAHSSRRVVQGTVWLTIGLVGYSAFDVGMANGVPLLAAAILAYTLVRLARSRTDLVDAPLYDRDVEPGPGPDGVAGGTVGAGDGDGRGAGYPVVELPSEPRPDEHLATAPPPPPREAEST